MKQPSMVRQAAEEFQRNNYVVALDLYRRLSKNFGERSFRNNILLCERRLNNSGRRTCTNIPLKKIKVAAVMDEFTYVSYKDTSTLINLSADHWAAELEHLQPDLLFIESAWRGKDDAWNRKISHASPELLGILDWCKEHNVPTMFWNKEDPVHYTTFLNIAKRFDYVFTTDIGCIANYKRELEHERVYLLPFACNPLEHNPIEKYQRKSEACFAGSYFVRYPERARDLDTLLETLLDTVGIEIFDRQYGNDDVNYAFPDKYKPIILGNLKYKEIDRAYKGYMFGVNLNSVKNSPSMFARRVFELLASNTLVVSNYSKGVRLLFGDLVVSSDAKPELNAKLVKLIQNQEFAANIRLACLRKVMTEHTYEHRFSYIAEKMFGRVSSELLPMIQVIATVSSQSELEAVVRTFRFFEYRRKRLTVIVPLEEGFSLPIDGDTEERLLCSNMNPLRQIVEDEYIAFIRSSNLYGKFYLLDLAIANKFTKAPIIAKGRFEWQTTSNPLLPSLGPPYSYGEVYRVDAALVSGSHKQALLKKITSQKKISDIFLSTAPNETFYTDGFGFAPETSGDNELLPVVTNLAAINAGIQGAYLLKCAEKISAIHDPLTAYWDKPYSENREAFFLRGDQLGQMLDIQAAEKRGIKCRVQGSRLLIQVEENANLPFYIYEKTVSDVGHFWPDRSGKLLLKTSFGLELSPVVIFFDADSNRISHSICSANWNQIAVIPKAAITVRLGIRVGSGSGEAEVKGLVFDHATNEENQFTWVPASKYLLIAPNYPEYDDYYRYGFVHRRVKTYGDNDFRPDVFRFRLNGSLKQYEFDNIDVISGGQNILRTILENSDYSCILIHALDVHMWEVISKHVDYKKIIVWLHGSEVQAWNRRAFNHQSKSEMESARANGKRRDSFWRMIFSLKHPNIHFVFVSEYLKNEVVSDLSVEISASNVSVIPNPIDVNLFNYERKDPEQRKLIVSIRPYASRVYANDLTVNTILELSKRPWFQQLKFLLVGDGPLFDLTVEPLKGFSNVELRKAFLSQIEIAALHKMYGVFLCPSRMDTQGVSRDEAMASGLVPITNRVGAISEFVPDGCGFICEEENYQQLADAVEALYLNPTLFVQMSKSAAYEVRKTRSSEHIYCLDMDILKPRGVA